MAKDTYLKPFSTFEDAQDWMITKNLQTVNRSLIYCVVPGPEDDYAVVDLRTAIELGAGYVIGYSRMSSTTNPWNKAA